MNGVKPAWANLPKRNCDDCGHKYKPKQPLREGQRGFCSDNCRKSYHKHGGAYRKLKVELEKMLDKRLRDLTKDLRPLLNGIIQEELRKYAQYAKVVEDHSIPLRIPAPAASPVKAVSPLPNPQRRA